jgi:hypothetical protein
VNIDQGGPLPIGFAVYFGSTVSKAPSLIASSLNVQKTGAVYHAVVFNKKMSDASLIR